MSMAQHGEWKEACEGLEAEHRDRSESPGKVPFPQFPFNSVSTKLCTIKLMVHPPANDCTSIPGACRKGAAALDPTQPQHAPQGGPSFYLQ